MTIDELKKKREERLKGRKMWAQKRDEAQQNLMATEGALIQLDELIAEETKTAKGEEKPDAQVIPFPEGEEAK